MSRKLKLITFIAIGLTFLCLFLSTGRAGDNIWTTTGPYGVRIYGLAIDPNNSSVIYASTPDGTTRVFKSVDGGITWLPSDNGIEIDGGETFGFAFDPDNPATVYVAYQGGVHASTDAGGTWELRSTYEVGGTSYLIRAWSIASSPADGTLYVGAYGCWSGLIGGVFRSRDGGETWDLVADHEMTDCLIRAIAVAPSAPHIIYAGGGSAGGIFKSVDGGDTWQRIDSSFAVPPMISALEVDPYDAQTVYIGVQGTGSGIYKTTNGGQTWSPIGAGLNTSDIWDIEVDPGNQQVMYLGGTDGIPGVYRSLDTGLSWAPMMDGMGSRAVYSLAIDHSETQNIYAGTGSGIWKYTLVSAPADYSITVNDGALFTNQTAVTLALTAPAGTTEMIISNDGGFVGATWEPFAAQKPWTITAYGSYVIPRIVYAKFKTYGQISGLYQDDIILDVTAPTGSIEISGTVQSANSAALPPGMAIVASRTDTLTRTAFLPSVTRNARPGFTLVHLLLSATDDVSGVSQMLLSNDAAFTESEWQAYATEMDWWVPEGVTTTVYVKFRDRAGNESLVYSDSVTP